MRTILALLLGITFVGNGLFMLADPAAWYAVVPGVPETGPLNAHFVRDIGCAYAVAGVALAWFAVDARARPAALAGGAFLALHALVHGFDAIGGREAPEQWMLDLADILAPALIALWLAWPPRQTSGPQGLTTRVMSSLERLEEDRSC